MGINATLKLCNEYPLGN